jgi:dTDP-4-dehydrorhamnose 3,5-epimerase
VKITDLDIAGVKLIEPKRHGDHRGFFCETYSKPKFAEAGIDLDFVQDNHSKSAAAGTLRGLHFQAPPTPQAKLVRVVRGAVLDVAVDIRRGSPTFGKHVAAELNEENFHQLLVPVGFAHGFVTLVPDTEVIYKVSGPYAPDCEGGLAWNDPQLAIDWRFTADDVTLSARDREWTTLAEFDSPFVYEEESGGRPA